MMQFHCDLCGRIICTENERRYVVRLEMYPVESDLELQREDLDIDLDIDPIEMMHKMIEEAIDVPEMQLPQVENKRYDMCPECYAKYNADPLGKNSKRKVHFSSN